MENTKRKKILIVEDDNGNRILLERFLSNFFEVTSKQNGKEGLEWMDNNRPDLVITDLQMPVINGIQFLKNTRSSLLLKDTRIIVISGHDNSALKKMCDRYGVLCYYVKPYDPIELVIKIYQVFNISIEGDKKLKKLMPTG